MRLVVTLLVFVILSGVVSAACIDLDRLASTTLPSGVHVLCPDRVYETPGLRIASDDTVLDCQGSHLYGSSRVGVFVDQANHVTIQHCVIEHFKSGIVLNQPGRVVLNDVFVRDNIFGIAVFENSSRDVQTSIYWNVSWFRNVVGLQRADVAQGPISPPEFAQLIALDAPPAPESVTPDPEHEEEALAEVFSSSGDMSLEPVVVIEEDKSSRNFVLFLLLCLVVILALLIRWYKRKNLNFMFYPAS